MNVLSCRRTAKRELVRLAEALRGAEKEDDASNDGQHESEYRAYYHAGAAASLVHRIGSVLQGKIRNGCAERV